MDRFRKKYKILVFAFLLTLIHAFIPHIHAAGSGQTIIQQEQTYEDLVNLVSRAFTFNLGYEHLENYKDSYVKVDLNIDRVLLQTLFIEATETEIQTPREVLQSVPLYCTEWLTSINITRGSPLFS